MESTFNPATIVIWLLCFGGCVALGNQKGRLGLGIALGFFCGLIGLVIMAIIKPKSRY